jgi:hypothetical protein
MPCYPQYDKKRQHIGFLCGKFGKPCPECGDVAKFLCDYPVGKNKTCNRILCDFHANEIAPDIHYCPAHYEKWQDFVKNGGVEKSLSNVIPYKKQIDLFDIAGND